MPDRTHLPPSLSQTPWLLLRLVPGYLRHLLWQPYRDRPARGHLRALLTAPILRHQIAIYDVVLGFLLRGYAELAGRPLRPETGKVAIVLMRLGFAFDDEFDRREAAGEPLDFRELFHSPQVRLRVREWRAFMEGFDTYAPINDFLAGYVGGLYETYRKGAENPGDFGAMMDRAVMDSGGLLAALAHIVGIFHANPATPGIVEQFTSLGVTAKLSDDMIDFSSDVRAGRPNLLRALVDDAGRADLAVSSGVRMGARWWRRTYPEAYRIYVLAFEEHQARISSRALRYASRVMWVPALLGHTRVETRGRI
ncbi:hypothetical protein Aph01nite_74420 [Acrocarpospora phusangensis]|uniref:Phytoene synthase n=1 Tax=Acrocarpospora phusangensis TaxID=1070424 RepID=A0A919USF2_9ACTN|nr:hypothetical protein [Acrocarpospora phusangensis]GIH29132.1 hypothetical protein Aph01nite_74420 [Acrocarpospora phusangensis]